MPVWAAKIGVGIGKSTAARSAMIDLVAQLRANGIDKTIAFAVPDHKLGNEAAEAFNAEAIARGVKIHAAIWRGRSAADPMAPDSKMCRDLARTYDAMAAGEDIETACCAKRMDDGTVIECPFFRQCGYQRQKQQRADVWFCAHDLLFHETPRVMGELAGLIVDESFWQAGLSGIEGKEPRSLTVETLSLAPTPPGVDGQRLHYLRRLLLEVLQTHQTGPLNKAAFTGDLTRDMALEANALEWRMKAKVDMHPGMSREEFEHAKRQGQHNKVIRRLSSIWKAVAALLAEDGPAASGWLSLHDESTREGLVRTIRIKGRREIRKGWRVPTLLMDATLEAELARFYFPQMEVKAEIDAQALHQRIIQVTGRTYSKRHFFENPKNTEHLTELAATLGRFSREYAPGDVLVIAQKKVREWLEQNGNLPGNIKSGHFNNVAGIDAWKAVAALVCIGRVLPPPAEVEALAEAVSGAAVERLPGWYQKRQVTRPMADGGAITAEVDHHPHPLCEAVRREICEGQLIQAIGRPRGSSRTGENPVDVWMLSDMTSPLPINETVDAETLDPGPIDFMLMEKGAAFSNSVHVSEVFRKRWNTDSAVRSAFNRYAKRCVAFSQKYFQEDNATLLPAGFVVAEYKLAGSGNDSHTAVFDLARVPDPEASLTENLGALVMFNIRVAEKPAVQVQEADVPTDAAPVWVIVPNPAALADADRLWVVVQQREDAVPAFKAADYQTNGYVSRVFDQWDRIYSDNFPSLG